MNFLTLYFVIPVIPLSGVKNLAQCPQCKTRYHNDAPGGVPHPSPPLADPWK